MTGAPVGTVVLHPDGRPVIMGRTGWLLCDGSRVDPLEEPGLEAIFHMERPRFRVAHPLRSLRARANWDRGLRYVYGGSAESGILLPYLMGRIVPPALTLPNSHINPADG